MTLKEMKEQLDKVEKMESKEEMIKTLENIKEAFYSFQPKSFEEQIEMNQVHALFVYLLDKTMRL